MKTILKRKRTITLPLVVLIIILLTLTSGCIQLPFFQESPETDDIVTEQNPDENQNSIENHPYEDLPSEYPIEQTPEPTPTPVISNITDWNPYDILPTPVPQDIRPSILKNDTINHRIILNTTYSGSEGLAGYAIGKDLNITTGPFSITFSVHPNVSSPLLVWAKFTVYDPWQNIVAEEGYNRGYTSEETKKLTIYREGRHYLTIEGEFASVDYSIQTGDPLPEVTLTPVPQYDEMEWMEGEGPY